MADHVNPISQLGAWVLNLADWYNILFIDQLPGIPFPTETPTGFPTNSLATSCKKSMCCRTMSRMSGVGARISIPSSPIARMRHVAMNRRRFRSPLRERTRARNASHRARSAWVFWCSPLSRRSKTAFSLPFPGLDRSRFPSAVFPPRRPGAVE